MQKDSVRHKRRGRKASRWLFGAASVLIFIVAYFSVSVYKDEHQNGVTVTFFDVASGDSVLIRTPSGKTILIDGGPDAATLRKISTALPFYDRTFDLVIVSHADASAVGGLIDVLDEYHVKNILEPDISSLSTMTTAYSVFQDKISEQKIHETVAESGMKIQLDRDVTLQILFSAAGQMIARLSYADTSFLFTGNATQKMEKQTLTTFGRTVLKSDLLLVGHNGSKASSASDFISAVSPTQAVISVSAPNRYDYPSQATLDTLVSAAQASVFQTGKLGTVTFVLDGTKAIKK